MKQIGSGLIPRPSPPPVCDHVQSVLAYCQWTTTRGALGSEAIL